MGVELENGTFLHPIEFLLRDLHILVEPLLRQLRGIGLERVDARAEVAFLVRRQRSEGLHQPADGAGLPPEELVGECLEVFVCGGGAQLRLELRAKLGDRVGINGV